ncbi:MAG: hypothetical protein L3K15_04145 [Thermoplasmata archaeon]|nr:hypothetical protein [Thermoplasmata archaeon]
MTDAAVAAASAILRKHGIRFAIVGGQAVALNAATATRDVDVMVTTDDYREAIARLGRDTELTLAIEGGPVTRFGITALRGLPLDLVDAGFFAGSKTGAEFFDFLLKEGSTDPDGLVYASPEVVWYTRLMTTRWRAYAEKIVTNVIDGLSVGYLDRVEEIARKFGTEATIHERIAYVREELKRPDLDGLIRRE